MLEYPRSPFHAQHVLPEQSLKRVMNAYYGNVSTYHKKGNDARITFRRLTANSYQLCAD